MAYQGQETKRAILSNAVFTIGLIAYTLLVGGYETMLILVVEVYEDTVVRNERT